MGWWDGKKPGSVIGDGPADVMDEAVRRVVLIYREEQERLPTLDELTETVEFVGQKYAEGGDVSVTPDGEANRADVMASLEKSGIKFSVIDQGELARKIGKEIRERAEAGERVIDMDHVELPGPQKVVPESTVKYLLGLVDRDISYMNDYAEDRHDAARWLLKIRRAKEFLGQPDYDDPHDDLEYRHPLKEFLGQHGIDAHTTAADCGDFLASNWVAITGTPVSRMFEESHWPKGAEEFFKITNVDWGDEDFNHSFFIAKEGTEPKDWESQEIDEEEEE